MQLTQEALLTPNPELQFATTLLREVATYQSNLYVPADWFFTLFALGAGSYSAAVYVSSINKLIDSGAYSESYRIPFMAGTVGSNAMLNVYFFLAFLNFERILKASFIKAQGVEFEGWSKRKHYTTLTVAGVSALPLVMLAYQENKSFAHNLGATLPQLPIFLCLQALGVKSLLKLTDWPYRKITGKKETEHEKIATRILTDFKLRKNNLEELIKIMEERPNYRNNEIRTLLNAMRTIKNRQALAHQEKAHEFWNVFYSTSILSKERSYPKLITYLLPLVNFALVTISATTVTGFIWDSKKDLASMLKSNDLAWILSLFSNLIFTALICDVTCKIVEATFNTLYLMLKAPLVPLEDNSKCITRSKSNLRRLLPYSMTQFIGLSLFLLIIMLILANFSEATSLELQNEAAEEWTTFQLKNKELWLAFVRWTTIAFNGSGAPELIAALTSLLTITFSKGNSNELTAEIQISLNSLDRIYRELELAGSENVIGFINSAIGLSTAETDTPNLQKEEVLRQLLQVNADHNWLNVVRETKIKTKTQPTAPPHSSIYSTFQPSSSSHKSSNDFTRQSQTIP